MSCESEFTCTRLRVCISVCVSVHGSSFCCLASLMCFHVSPSWLSSGPELTVCQESWAGAQPSPAQPDTPCLHRTITDFLDWHTNNTYTYTHINTHCHTLAYSHTLTQIHTESHSKYLTHIPTGSLSHTHMHTRTPTQTHTYTPLKL